MAKKIKVGILFGGKSAEHEVSLQSAKNVFDAIDKNKYQPILIGINKKGKWMMFSENCVDFILNPNNPQKICLNGKAYEVAMIPQSKGKIYDFEKKKICEKIDVVFPILHGTFGEDGTVQGLLKLVDIPFVGAGVLGSAVGMDKDVMKRLLQNYVFEKGFDSKIKIGKYLVINKNDFCGFDKISKALGLPLFVKPANLGSSVGVSKVNNQKDFEQAVQKAFLYDTKIIIEENIKGREIECAVLGNNNPKASICGEVIVKTDFYSYASKYIDENGAELKIPAELTKKQQNTAQKIAIKTFQILCCSGFGRVDMFLKDNGEIFVNEINTIPGFTKNSMYPKLWEASGMDYSDLIDRLITLAIEKYDDENSKKYFF